MVTTHLKSDTIVDLVRNKKVEALKIFRDLNPGISLEDAASSVDEIDHQLRQQNVR